MREPDGLAFLLCLTSTIQFAFCRRLEFGRGDHFDPQESGIGLVW